MRPTGFRIFNPAKSAPDRAQKVAGGRERPTWKSHANCLFDGAPEGLLKFCIQRSRVASGFGIVWNGV